MEEARTVLERLRRIELLDREGAAPLHVLAEVRQLLTDVQAWLAVEGGETEDVDAALQRSLDALERRPVVTGG